MCTCTPLIVVTGMANYQSVVLLLKAGARINTTGGSDYNSLARHLTRSHPKDEIPMLLYSAAEQLEYFGDAQIPDVLKFEEIKFT